MSRSKRASSTLRSTTSPSIPTVSVSEFVRGAIYDLTEPTMVMSHSTELGTWYPRGQGVSANYFASSTSSTPTLDFTGSSNVMLGSTSATAPLTSQTISAAVEAAVMKATQHLEESTTRTITRLMNEQKGNTSGE